MFTTTAVGSCWNQLLHLSMTFDSTARLSVELPVILSQALRLSSLELQTTSEEQVDTAEAMAALRNLAGVTLTSVTSLDLNTSSSSVARAIIACFPNLRRLRIRLNRREKSREAERHQSGGFPKNLLEELDLVSCGLPTLEHDIFSINFESLRHLSISTAQYSIIERLIDSRDSLTSACSQIYSLEISFSNRLSLSHRVPPPSRGDKSQGGFHAQADWQLEGRIISLTALERAFDCIRSLPALRILRIVALDARVFVRRLLDVLVDADITLEALALWAPRSGVDVLRLMIANALYDEHSALRGLKFYGLAPRRRLTEPPMVFKERRVRCVEDARWTEIVRGEHGERAF